MTVESGPHSRTEIFSSEEFSRSLAHFLFMTATSAEKGDPHEIPPGFERLSLPEPLVKLEAILRQQINRFSPSQGFELPRSAKPFVLYHKNLGRKRQIDGFQSVLRGKIFRSSLFENAVEDTRREVEHVLHDSSKPGLVLSIANQRVLELQGLYNECPQLYKQVSEKHIPLYKSAVRKLKKLSSLNAVEKTQVFRERRSKIVKILKRFRKKIEKPNVSPTIENPTEVYHGRDGRGVYLARKAEMFGRRNKTLIYILSTRDIIGEDEFLGYLLQEGVTFDTYHIDSGFLGSTPALILEKLGITQGLAFTLKDIDERVKLLCSNNSSREHLAGNFMGKASVKDIVGDIEHVADFFPKPVDFEKGRGGRKKVKLFEVSEADKIKAWVTEQAIIRAFVPKRYLNEH